MASHRTDDDPVIVKLTQDFVSDLDGVIRIIDYLAQEDTAYRDQVERIGPVRKILQNTINATNVFNKYVERFFADMKKAESDEAFANRLSDTFSQMMDPQDRSVPREQSQSFDLQRMDIKNVTTMFGHVGMAKGCVKLYECLLRQNSGATVEKMMGLVQRHGGAVCVVALAAVSLTYDVCMNIWGWWKGTITGARCAKNIVDSFGTLGAGMAGGAASAAVATVVAGPVAGVAASIIGGIACAAVANVLLDRMTQTLFGVPKEVALENAYRYLEVDMDASNNDINMAYRRLCLTHHPDKNGGNSDEFKILQVNMEVIKVARKNL